MEKARAAAGSNAVRRKNLEEALAHLEEARSGTIHSFCGDLLRERARNLLRDNEQVRRDLQGRFTHIFVDEFQDTEPLQAEVLMLLASADPTISDWRQVCVVPGKLFIVGDPKQAIYRFRRADVGLYFDVKDRLVAGGAVAIQLTTRVWNCAITRHAHRCARISVSIRF